MHTGMTTAGQMHGFTGAELKYNTQVEAMSVCAMFAIYVQTCIFLNADRTTVFLPAHA
jgi:hypothetical protein